MRHFVLALGLSFVATAIAAPSSAAVLFDTINGTPANPASRFGRITAPGNAQQPTDPTLIIQGGPLAVSFVAPYATTISSVTLQLAVSAPSDGGSVMVYLVSDVGGAPSNNGLSGTSFAFTSTTFLGQILDSDINSVPNPSLETVFPNVYITPGQYWLALVNDIGPITGTARWDYTADWVSGVGAPGQKNFGQYPGAIVWGLGDAAPYNNGLTTDPTQQINGLFMAQIVDTPEPATLAILGAGLAGLGLWRKRRATA